MRRAVLVFAALALALAGTAFAGMHAVYVTSVHVEDYNGPDGNETVKGHLLSPANRCLKDRTVRYYIRFTENRGFELQGTTRTDDEGIGSCAIWTTTSTASMPWA